jgi:hypothetical protein
LLYGGIFDEQTRRKPLAIAADAFGYGIEFGIPGVKPFVIQNLGKYERQAWQEAEFRSNGQNDRTIWKNRENVNQHTGRFILDLYHAKPMNGHAWIHGPKSGRMVHVSAVTPRRLLPM